MPYSSLLTWYDLNKRVLPFRGTRDPYAIWISEIMLQQTRTETVSSYYTRFMNRFPSVRDLALAQEQEVLKLWEGLGYYSRARNLHKAAKIIHEEYNDVFPRSHEAVRALPGIGGYTAAAICSIAYRQPYPAIDGNLTRVISRVHGVREDVGIPSVKRQIEALGKEYIDSERPGDWNQALMDLGATICLPGTPDCSRCPLKEKCSARLEDDAELLPVRAAAKPPKPVPMGVALVTHNGRILIQQRDTALLKGLWVFLLLENDDTPEGLQKKLRSMGIEAELKADLGEARHIFTHRIWNMKIYHFEAVDVRKKPDYQFVTADELAALPLPTAVKAARKWAMELIK